MKVFFKIMIIIHQTETSLETKVHHMIVIDWAFKEFDTIHNISSAGHFS